MSSIHSFLLLAWRAICVLTVWSLCANAVQAQSALLDMPTRVAVDAQNNVFVIEVTAKRIAKFNASGVLVTRFGGPGTAAGQFASVQDIAIDPAGNVLVLDRIARALLRFTNAGNFIDRWQLFSTVSSQRPHSLVVDASGRVFVSSSDNGGNLTMFSPTGQFVMGMPVITGLTGDDTPGDLAMDGSGNLYAADRANNRVLKFGTNGPANDPLSWLGWIGGCSAGPLCQAMPAGVGAPSRTTRWCTDFSQCADSRPGVGRGRFQAPIYVSAAANGALLVSDIGSGAIQRFDANGAYVGDLAARGRMPGQIGGSDATAITANGDIYVVQQRLGRVSRFTANGTFVAVFGGGIELSVFPGDTALNPLKFTTPSTLNSTIGVTSIGGYTGPLSVAATGCIGPGGPPAKPCAALGISTAMSNASVTVPSSTGVAPELAVTVSPSTPDGLMLVVVESTTPGLPSFAQVAIDVKLQRRLSVVLTPNDVTLMPGDPKKDVSVSVTSVNVSAPTSAPVVLSAAFASPPATGHMNFHMEPNSSFPISVNAVVTRTLEVTANPNARSGNFTLNVKAAATPSIGATSPLTVHVACNCNDTGDFLPPVVRPVSVTSGLSGTSPDGRFVVTAASTGTSASVTVAAVSNPAIALVPSVPNATAWGFSPDSRYFLVANAGPSSHITMLDIYDLTHNNRRVVTEQITSCPVGDPTCVPPPSYCYGGGSACTSIGGATQTSGFKVGSAGWGFAPDSKSFMIAAVNPLVSSSQYQLRLYNLAGATTGSAPVILSTTESAISAFWQFSPCGDLFMHFHQAFAVPSSNDVAHFYRTNSTSTASASETAYLIVASNGQVGSGPVGAQVVPAFFSKGDFDVKLLNLSHSGSPANGFQSPQCQRR